MATYIMPCPIISLSIVVYAGYRKKNKLLLTLLTSWGLTGVKSMMFNAYEDLILLICGIYGIVLIINEFRQQKGNESVDVTIKKNDKNWVLNARMQLEESAVKLVSTRTEPIEETTIEETSDQEPMAE